ncbi:MAG: sigma-70 family RNA polymerase sigma factor [Verrucomicrobia bacterium]|nr:sigma-70 family RNA polymerase sigma factor [Verrucomicrobiota bacterium]
MQDKSDAQLLREYARKGSEAAFREIVQRHTDLIYSAALRQVPSPDLAGDVTQTVFADLARKAPSLAESFTENSSVLGWLYRSTRFASLSLLRDERRRHEREMEAMEQFITASETSEDWSSLSPVLDEAMAELSDPEREAVLLRFFKHQDFHKIGATLGISDDTAQKRVSRAIDKLRTQLTRRGVTMTVSVLSTTLAANAVNAAPIGLTTAISSAVVVAGSLQTTGTITAGKIFFMTTTQKALVATTLVVAVGTGIYQTYQAAQLREQMQSFSMLPAPGDSQKLKAKLADLESRLALAEQENDRLRLQNGEIHKLRAEVARLRNESQELAQLKEEISSDPTMLEAIAWKQRVQSLKQHLQDNPQVGIPELQFATEEDWLDAARWDLETERNFREAMASLRANVQNEFTSTLADAVQEFMAKNDKNFPTDVSQLRPYFDPPVDDAILERYGIIPSFKISGFEGWMLTQKSAVDEEFDTRNWISADGYGSSSGRNAWDDRLDKALRSIKPAMQAYAAANPGKKSSDLNGLLPYLTTDEERQAFEHFLRVNREQRDSKKKQ